MAVRRTQPQLSTRSRATGAQSPSGPTSDLRYYLPKEFSMSKFAIGDKVDRAADDRESGVIIAVFSTDDGNFRYAVDMEGYGALQFVTEEKLVVHPSC
jgi:hypothetical protein